MRRDAHSINTVFERLNPSLRSGQALPLRQSLTALARRTLCLAKTKRYLQLRLNAYLVYYYLIREPMALHTTPACSVGVTDHAWTWEELLTFRLRPEHHTTVAD